MLITCIQGMVKLEPIDTSLLAVAKVKNEATAASGELTKRKRASGTRSNNNDLPDDSERVFRQVVIPTLYQMVATVENGWEIADEKFIEMLTSIWEVAFRKKESLLSYEIELRGPVFVVVSCLSLQLLLIA